MVVSILALVVLILVTPVLLGRPPPEITAQPLLIIGMNENRSSFIVTLRGAVDAYRYDLIRLAINGSNPSANWTFRDWANETEIYDLHRRVPGNLTFSVNVYLVDRQENFFEYNVTTRTETDANNLTWMVFTFPFERDRPGPEVRRLSTDDFRLGIPRRGRLVP